MQEESMNINLESDEQKVIQIRNTNSNEVGQSGNSDVDLKIDVHVDTTAIGYAILCSLLATKQMDNDEFKTAVRKLEELTRKSFFGKDVNDLSNVKLFNKKTI
jgi:ABC-type transporter Mla MlaB component